MFLYPSFNFIKHFGGTCFCKTGPSARAAKLRAVSTFSEWHLGSNPPYLWGASMQMVILQCENPHSHGSKSLSSPKKNAGPSSDAETSAEECEICCPKSKIQSPTAGVTRGSNDLIHSTLIHTYNVSSHVFLGPQLILEKPRLALRWWSLALIISLVNCFI